MLEGWYARFCFASSLPISENRTSSSESMDHACERIAQGGIRLGKNCTSSMVDAEKTHADVDGVLRLL